MSKNSKIVKDKIYYILLIYYITNRITFFNVPKSLQNAKKKIKNHVKKAAKNEKECRMDSE